MKQFTVYNLQFTIKKMRFPILVVFFLFFTFYILHSTYYIPIAFASCITQSSNPRVQDGLISATAISTNFGSNIGKCAEGNQTSFAPFKIPSYADLKSLYFDQSKQVSLKHTIAADADGNTHQGNDGSPIDVRMSSGIYYFTGNLIIDNGVNCGINLGGGTAIVFIEGNLTINCDLAYNNNNGLVFVVNGNVRIDKSVTLINAVIISQGIIYTATDKLPTPPILACSHISGSRIQTGQLVINGSLISLNRDAAVTSPIEFCRILNGSANNTTPAEQINQQPKYLVILKDLFSDTLQKWSEIQ